MAPKKGNAKAKADPKKQEPKEETVEEEKPKGEVAKEDKAAEAKKDDAEMKDESAQEAKEEGEAEQNEPEKPKEQEADAAADKRAKVKEGSVALNYDDATLNIMPVNGGKMLMSLTEGGMQYLLASARCNSGIKAGRYMFETRILESLHPFESQGSGRSPMPRQLVRIGFSLAGSSLFLADGASNLCFDSEGFFVHDKQRTRASQKFVRDQTVAVLLNLDSSSPNANTVSLFINGTRASAPIPLPEHLHGQTLFPTITYKNVSLEVNFGPTSWAPLPFVCRMIGGAATADLEVAKPQAKTKSGKHEVVFPVGLPEMGYFDWVDEFLEKNPGYVELSDRKILDWAAKSGIWRARAQSGPIGSNDKPEASSGVPALDDWSVSRVIAAIAPTLPRNYVVPELKANLVKSDREEALMRFSTHDFLRKAVVIMGEPDQAYKERVHSRMLEEKKAKAEAEKKRKAQDEERNRAVEERRKKSAEARKDYEAAEHKKQGEEAEEGLEAPEKEGEAEEAKAEDGKEDKATEETKEDEKMEEAEVPVELTEEEKKLMYRKSAMPDIAERELAKSYAAFALPTKAEGFEDVTFAWQKEASCSSLLKSWVLEKKLTQRAEDLTPGADFKEKWSKWGKVVQEWRRCQTDFKDPAKQKAAKEKKAEEAKAKLEEEKKALIEAGDEDGAKKLDEKAAEAEPEPMEIDMENLDVLAVEDIMDVGNGEPLFAHFTYDDWTLLGTRYELHLLLHSFKKDLNDPDRPSFGLKHLGYYYNKYYKKTWSFQQFNVPEFDDLVDLLKESISVDSSSGHLRADDPEDAPLERFVKLTEDNRRERLRRIEAGDETARLKFTRPSAPAPRQDKGGSGKGGYGKGGKGAGAPAYGSSGGAYSAQKRPYTPPAAPAPYAAKQQRTTYGGGGYGGGGGYRGGSYGSAPPGRATYGQR